MRRSKKASSRAAAWRSSARKQALEGKLKGDNHDQDAGIKIVLRALEEPLRQIVGNAGDEPSVVLNKVLEGKGNYGYNAQTGEYGDLVEMGVLDPTKVTRYALQNAASVAGLILTTDAMVAELAEEKKAAAAATATAAWGHGRHGRHGHVSPAVNCSTGKGPARRPFSFVLHCPRGGGRCGFSSRRTTRSWPTACMHALRHSGYAVDWVKNGAEADSALDADEFDLLILDLGLPKKSGPRCAQAPARARLAHAGADPHRARRRQRPRARPGCRAPTTTSRKPFDLAELEARVRALTRRGMAGSPTLLHARRAHLRPGRARRVR